MYLKESFIISMSSIHKDKSISIPDHAEEREDFIHHNNTMTSIFSYIKHLDLEEIEEGFNRMMMKQDWHKTFWNRNPTLLEWLNFFKITLTTQVEIDQKSELRVQSDMNYITYVLNDQNCHSHFFVTKYKFCERFRSIVNQFCNLKEDLQKTDRMLDMAKYICDKYNKNPKEFYHNLRAVIVLKMQKDFRSSKYNIVIQSNSKDLIKIK